VGSPPKLTIGMPVYNGGQFVAAAIESILAQTFSDFELIISDNASTDETSEVARGFAARDQRVRYRRNKENVGLSANNNLLVPLARGRLFKWAPCDDILRPTYLERCVAILDADPSVVIAYPQTDFIDAIGSPLDLTDPGWHLMSDDPYPRLRYAIGADQYMNVVLGVIRIDALRQTRLLPRYSGGDCRLVAELAGLGKFCEVPERLYVRRIHKGSTAGNTGNTVWLRHHWSGTRRGMTAPYWRLLRDYSAIIASAPISRTQKADLLARLARAMVHQRRRLLDEISEAALIAAGRS
jgi:glycosyltransferase involved in cell wall biosynthesis